MEINALFRGSLARKFSHLFPTDLEIDSQTPKSAILVNNGTTSDPLCFNPNDSGVTSDGGVIVDGRYYHAIQLKGTGGDNWKLQAILDHQLFGKAGWVDIAANGQLVNPLIADGIYQFTGIYHKIRAVKISGAAGTLTMALASRA